MKLLERTARAILKRAGWGLIPPEEAPRAGSVWEPTRGHGERRTVLEVGGGRVNYHASGAVHGVSLLSWMRWVRKTRAVRS